MNEEYKKQYDELVEKVQKERRGIKHLKDHGRYYNVHHIKPRSLGGSDASHNLIKFTHEEHFEAHRLLFLMYKGTNSRTEYKMAHAFMAMSMNERFTSRDYSEAKKSMYDIGISEETRKRMAIAASKNSLGRVQSEDVMKKRGLLKISYEDIQIVIDEITKRCLDGEGTVAVDKDIAKRYGVNRCVIYYIRIRKGSRYSKFPQTLTKGNFMAARVNQRRINLGKKPMTKKELVDWANKVDGENPIIRSKCNEGKNKPLTKEQIQYRADVRASFKKK